MKKIIRSVFFPLVSRWEGNGRLLDDLALLEESQYRSREEIRSVQLEDMKKLLKHAYEQTHFYRRRFDACGLHPDRIHDFDDLKKIPVLTKNDIRDNLESMTARNFAPSQLQSSLSGGTTGLVTKFFMNRQCVSPKLAAVIRFDRWAGWDIADWMGLVWPATLEITDKTTLKTKVKNYISHRRIKIAMTVVDENQINGHLRMLKKHKATMIRAFPTPLYEVARYLLNHPHPDITPELSGIVTTGEVLYPHQRETIEKAFGCLIMDSYRTRETGPIAQECEHHQGYHINSECVYVETIPRQKSDAAESDDADQEKVLVTDLLNYGMPLIRYEIGDVGALSGDTCPCGRGLPLLKNVAGRLVDVVYTPQKKRIASITLIPNLVHSTGILNRTQIIQHDFDRLTIRIEKPEPRPDQIKEQKEMIDRLFQARMDVTYEFVDEIPLLKSGKYAFVVCKIPKEKLVQVDN